MSVLQHGPGRQNFGWVGHNALDLPIIGVYIQLILRKISKKNWCRQMSDCKTEMHQIRFPLGRVGSATYPRSPDPWLYLRGLLLQGCRGGEGRVRGRGRNKKRGRRQEGRLGRDMAQWPTQQFRRDAPYELHNMGPSISLPSVCYSNHIRPNNGQ